MPASTPERPDYGIDAPVVIRNLFVVGILCLVAWGGTTLTALSGRYRIPQVMLGFAGMAFLPGVLCVAMGFWILWESKIGKLRRREWLLDRVHWTGTERVLDVGCGRGLLMIAAAKRLTSGKAAGIDVWQSEDLSGNHAYATVENARREGVLERVEVYTADMRQMPFANDTFDVIVSRAAIHNLYKVAERDQAIREIARVMKPGARAVIDDIRHYSQYARVFAESGVEVRRLRSVSDFLLMLMTFGGLRPATFVAQKSKRAV